MALKAGIVGLPNVGKSTLFNAITNSQVEAANYPFATIEPNVGIVELQDKRIDKLVQMVKPHKVIKATFEFTDIAGLVAGASKGEGLGNKFLANIREVDAIVQVVRCFEDTNVTHVMNKIEPVNDMKIINLELLLADIETLNNVVNRTKRIVQNTNNKFAKAEFEVASKILKVLETENPARLVDLDKDELKIAKSYNLLTLKPLIYVGNVEEEFINNPLESTLFVQMANQAKKEKAQFLGISAKIESEIAQLEKDDQQIFLADLGINETGLNKLVSATFKLLNLATYFTAGVKEVKAWTFKQGMKAPQCAGLIHSDFERGFIKAEIVKYQDFVEYQGEHGAKAAGKYRFEGKEYVFEDGDIVNFKFNI